ncbi:MarR family winged helix-turn-helix transcriptional regulator [Mycolicibacterium mengxianglii]|uniref:MarR family winged helix-turn-helix transcriptional regulator n=1 Tax=Mycolicibacterium mengxianglii TaxID=2736649 RepID=UPI0018D0E61A|nr:MarR family transcriptional regulator [Mycolicibacterium mengxianglii]
MTDSTAIRQYAVKSDDPACVAFAELIDQIGRLATVIEAIGNGLARPSGQSLARWQVLAAVQNQPAPVSAIAAQLGHTRQSVQRIADLLVDDELAIYRPNPAHKRAKILEINAAGLTALHRLQALFNQLAQRTSAGLEPEHLDLARHTLDELRQRLESELPHLPRD